MTVSSRMTKEKVQWCMDQVLNLVASSPFSVHPDPKVAAIILDEKGILTASYRKRHFGEPHSEAKAIVKAYQKLVPSNSLNLSENVLQEAKYLLSKLEWSISTPGFIKTESQLESLFRLSKLLNHPLKKSSLFVNLEPCSHFGKNPSCAHLIYAAGLKKVYFANYDPDPGLSGKLCKLP